LKKFKKYKYNPANLSYDEIKITYKEILFKILFLILFGLVSYFTISYIFESPEEKRLKDKIFVMWTDIQIIINRIDGLESIINEIESKDSVIYKSLFESEPDFKMITEENNDKNYKSNYIKFVEETHQRLNVIQRKITEEYSSYENIEKLALQKEDYFKKVPAIQPISNKDLRRTASGWGWRTHPIYKIRKFHYGLDFSAKEGTPIFATGDATVEYVKSELRGYGNFVILNHGYGFKTLYGHMSKFNVKNGQKVKRGDIIGFVGTTGTSTGTHLHYEVLKNDQRINPINFFFNDLTPDEYEKMIKISNSMNQTFD
jgi:murein DD-endopeptidase MepM/ murein hydrolase activator NlpD